MSHLHIPDGVLPPWLWASGVLLALLLLALSARAGGAPRGAEIAFRGALGGIVLLAMAIEIPLGPIEYHLSLVGPAGVLLGPAGAFQVMFVVCAILAFARARGIHGGGTQRTGAWRRSGTRAPALSCVGIALFAGPLDGAGDDRLAGGLGAGVDRGAWALRSGPSPPRITARGLR